ncbi:MAG: hypothetical protein PUJ39_06400, partial [Eubacteriales bacterium]|nr:hypothetical protein [Eubacteriales bacterium]
AAVSKFIAVCGNLFFSDYFWSLIAACPALSKAHENGLINPAFSPQTCKKSYSNLFRLSSAHALIILTAIAGGGG